MSGVCGHRQRHHLVGTLLVDVPDRCRTVDPQDDEVDTFAACGWPALLDCAVSVASVATRCRTVRHAEA